jgi:hypothetical protein
VLVLVLGGFFVGGCAVGTMVVDVEPLAGGALRVKTCQMQQGLGGLISLEKCEWGTPKQPAQPAAP